MAGPSSPELDWFDLAQTIGIDDVDSLGLPHISLPGFLDDFTLPPVSAGAGTGTVTPTGYNAPQDDMHVPVPVSNLFSPTLPENLLPQLAPMPPPRPLRILPEDQIMDIRKHLTQILTKHSFSVADKEKIIGSFPDGILNNFMHIIKPRDPAMLPSPSPPGSPARSEHDSQRTLSPFEGEPNLNEDNYTPKEQHDHSFVDPNAPQPVYPMFVGHFKSRSEARKFRKRARYPPKTNASDVQRVKRYGRQYWVQELYEAMIDISEMADGKSSIHRNRFLKQQAFDPMDLEATAHHVFDAAIAVHERGWSRPTVYHKKVVRGKLTDVSEKSVETRLARICMCFRQNKATVDDAIRGGVTLALLCDNPEARGFTKASNNTGNERRGQRLKMVKKVQPELEQRESVQRESEHRETQQEYEQRLDREFEEAFGN